MSIESIAGLKGLGGSYPMSRGSSIDRSQPPAQQQPQQDGGLLQDTARELEQLFDEFQSLRNAISSDNDIPSPPRSLAASVEASSFVGITQKVEELQSSQLWERDDSRQQAELVKELAIRNRELASMRHNQESIGALLQAHDDKNSRLQGELQQTKEQLRRQNRKNQQLADSRAVSSRQLEDDSKLRTRNIEVARQIEREKAHALTAQAPILEVLNTLESDGAAKDRRLKVLEDEIKSLKKAIREKDKVIEVTVDELEEIKQRPNDSAQLQNDIKMLLHTIDQLQDENKTMVRLDSEKSAVIEDLTLQLDNVDDDSYEVKTLQNELQARSIQNKELLHEVHTLQLAEQKRTKRILEEEQQDVAMTAKEWMDERKLMQARNKKLSDGKDEAVRSVKAQDVKIATLQRHLSSISQAVKESKVRRLPSSMPDEEAVGEEGELRESDGADYERWVPAAMYHFLEEEMKIMRVDVEEKCNMLLERDELTEALERKVDVITRAKAAESSRGSRELARLNAELEEARASFAQTANQSSRLSKASTRRPSVSKNKGVR